MKNEKFFNIKPLNLSEKTKDKNWLIQKKTFFKYFYLIVLLNLKLSLTINKIKLI